MTHSKESAPTTGGLFMAMASVQSNAARPQPSHVDYASSYAGETGELSRLRQHCEMLEKQLSKKHAQLCETQESLGLVQADFQTFALAASHDLQAPLRSITGFSQYLREEYEEDLDDVAKDYVQRIVASSNKMKNQLAGLSNFAKVSSQAAPFDAVCLVSAWETAVVKHEQKIKEHGIAIAQSTLPIVFGDRVQLETLFTNLIDNCINFRGTQSPEVNVSAKKQDKKWIITIEDNGIGIPVDRLDCVFKIFRHLDSDKSHRGVGLTVCRRIVERHSGRIYFCSQKRNGSKCVIELPAWSPP
jgi:light-regulated signal transduction histidine kinase (bacteriophytochrome)